MHVSVAASRVKILAVTLCSACAAFGPSAPLKAGTYLESGGTCVMEAENAAIDQRSDNLTWQVGTSETGYAGTGYVYTPDHGTTEIWNNAAELAWQVHISTPGSYYVAVRRIAPSLYSDSAGTGADGTMGSATSFSMSATEWKWARCLTPIGNLSAGEHTIQIRRNEDGFLIDRVMIAASMFDLPMNASTEVGPAESSQGTPDTDPPAAPTNLAVSSVSYSQVELDWSDNTEGDLDHYAVKRSETSGGPYTTIAATVSSSQYIDSSVGESSSYYYVVTAIDTSENESANSSQVLAQTPADNQAPTPDPLTWQTQPYAVDSSSVSMTATTASDASGVEYYFEETSGNPGANSSGWQDSPTYVDSGLTEGLAYNYRVKARDKSAAQNETTWSSTLSATPSGGDGGSGAYQESGGICVMEAENADISQRSDLLTWQVGTMTAGYAGTGHVYTANNGTTTLWADGSELSWTVQIQTSGTYYLAARRVAPDYSSDSICKGVDDVEKMALLSGTATQWTWIHDSVSFGTLSAGTHTIQIRRREDGFQIDRVVIADSTAKLPTNGSTSVGPPESPRDVNDNDPPSPSPMTWQSPPYAVDSNSVSMTATTASDASGVEYYFEETSENPGANSSGWQDSSAYVDSGLTTGLAYTYRVKARDKSPSQNETSWSSALSATPAADSDPPAPSPLTWQTSPYAIDGNSVSMMATTASDASGVEYYFEETSGNPGATSSGWQDSSTYVDSGLVSGLTYSYRVKARDKSPAQNEGSWSSMESATPSSGGSGESGVYRESGGICVMEAENATIAQRADTMTWQVDTTTAGYAGTGYVYTPDNATTSSWNNGTELAWEVDIQTPGNYYMAIRRIAPSFFSDSASAGSDDTQSPFTSITGTAAQWTWLRCNSMLQFGTMTVGQHTVQIRRSEDGLLIDRVIIADSQAKLPANGSTEMGPAETPHDPPAAQWATVPYAIDGNSITMVARAEGISEPVQYYIEDVNSSAHNSGWISSRSWTDTNLAPESTHWYRVKARDGQSEETAWSVVMQATTWAAPGDVPEGSAEPVSGELGNNLNLQVDPFTGSVGYTMPISLPPGRQGSEPSLSLRYGGGGNGWCGVGWSLGMGAIQRDTRRGVPVARDPNGQFANHYEDDRGFVVAFGAVNSRLVEVDEVTGEYRAETDQAFLKYEFDRTNNRWIATDKSGNKFYFGSVAGEYQGEVAGAAMVHPQFDSVTDSDNTFLWALGKIQDINGNLSYMYYGEDANQVYLNEVRYNGHTEGLPTTSSVRFVLNDPNDPNDDRPDKSMSYATGYRVENNRRLNDIAVWVYDYDQSDWARVRRYHLDYERSPSTLRSLLSSVTVYGTSDANSLPPVSFEYQVKPFEFERDANGTPILRDWGPLDADCPTYVAMTDGYLEDLAPSGDYYPYYVSDYTLTNLTDLDNDGLPDRVMTNTVPGANPFNPASNPPGNVFKAQLNTGTGFSGELLDWGPIDGRDMATSARWNSSSSHMKGQWADSMGSWGDAELSICDLIDLNSDGFLDRVIHRNTPLDASYAPTDSQNYFYVQLGTGVGFARAGQAVGGGSDFVTQTWGPLDLQGFVDHYHVEQGGDYPWYEYSYEGYFWSSLQCTWQPPDYGITRLMMLDINADGLPDRVMQGVDGQSWETYGFYPSQNQNLFRVQLNTGSGFERTTTASGGGVDYVTLQWGPVDAQGATGVSANASAWNALTAESLGAAFVAMLDINGDGLPDRVMTERSQGQGGDPTKYDVFRVQFNTGYGFERSQAQRGGGTDFVTRDWGPLNSLGSTDWRWNCPQATYSHNEHGDDSYARTYVNLFDINGDGLPDRVMQRASSPFTVLMVELNTGTGFSHQIDGNDIQWLGVSSQDEGDEAYWSSPRFTVTDPDDGYIDYSIEYVTMCDINGDGLVDRVMRETSAAQGGDPAAFDVFKVQLNTGPCPDLLCKVNGSLGGSVEVAYTPSTQYDNTDHAGISRLGFPVQTASSVTVDDGLGHQSTTRYQYARGMYDGIEREFRGFGKVSVTDSAGATSITYFHQGGGYEDPNAGEYADAGSVAKTGMPYRVEVYGSDGKLYTVTVNKIEEAESEPDTGWTFAYVSQTTKLEYAGVGYEPACPNYPPDYRAKVRRSEYDIAGKTGNILKSIDLGEVDLGSDPNDIAANIAGHTYTTNLTPDDDLYIHTAYATFANADIKNKIASTKTTSDYAGNNKLKEIVFTYDTKGRVLTEKAWLDKDKDGPENRYTTTSEFSYDTYGNRSQSIDKAGVQTDTTYDASYRMYPVEKDTEGFITSTDFDIRSGLPVRTVDPADMVSESVYDEFFRLTDAFASIEPNGPADLWLTHIEYNLGSIDANGVTRNYVRQVHEGYDAYTYSDGLGRIVQTRTQAEVGAPKDHRVASTIYDERGNVSFQTLPFFVDGNDYTPPYHYEVYLDTSTPLTQDDRVFVGSDTQFQPVELVYDTTYYWQVRKLGANGEVLDTSNTWQFSTESPSQSEWRSPENPPVTLPGLEYAYYNDELPLWSSLPDFGTLLPDDTGVVSTFDIGISDDDIAYGMRFTGYVDISVGGSYTFYTASNDGSQLYLGDTLVVNNDGVHGVQESYGSVELKAGKHAITVTYFQWLGGQELTVRYKGPDTSDSKITIPAGVLSRDDPNSTAAPDPYHQASSVSVGATFCWDGVFQQTAWDRAQAGVLTEYDGLGRVCKVRPAGGEPNSPTGPSTTVYCDGADPWAQVNTDAEGKVTKRYFDTAGRVIRIAEVIADGNDVVLTGFEYDRLGRLVRTVDDANNVFEAEYDSLGRKIRSVDPDMGTWTYSYDDAGRMTEQIDARGNKVQFAYVDDLGRVSQKTVRNPSNTIVETVTYTYDQSDDAEYTVHKGQLYKVTDGQGWTKTGYDSRGRAIKTTRYLSEADEEYTTHTAYDVADRVTQITYPDARAVIAYNYDEVGHLVKVESLWGTGANEVFYQASGFNEIGQETRIDYGNGRTTEYEYYERTRRLKRMVTLGDPNLQDIRYTYDMTSNITSVIDDAHTGAQSCGLSEIQYDDLHRLVSLYSASEAATITYEYDALGNIHRNGEMGAGTYSYHATKPHAVISANGNSYAYDACGNMTTRNSSTYGNQTLTYDEQNRLGQVAISGGSIVQFGYSGGGSRLWKKVNGQITGLWIGSLYEEKDGKILCHVYAGDRLVATFEPESALACIVQNNRYLAALWNSGDKALTGLFGGGRAPVTVMWAAALAGIALGLRYNRRRLRDRYGLRSYYGLRAIGGSDPWRQMVLLTLAAAVFLSSNPQAAYADTPTYDPVFYYYHPDHLGSAQLMTDRAGEVVQYYGYSPFGCERYRANNDAFSVSNRYTGQTLDEETGLYYYGARYYDPELARFIQADSTVPDPEFSQAYNRYAYVYNNPLKFTDPTGQFPWALAAAVMKVVSAFNTLKAICVAVHVGDFRGLAIGLASSILGGAIGGQIGGAIANGSQLAIALGGAIGAATFTAAFTGGNVARAIGEAVVWAYASHYCKLKANATTASAGERSIGEEHVNAIRATCGDQQAKPLMLWARFGAKDDSPAQRTWRDWAWGKVNDAVNWTMDALPSDESLYCAERVCTTVSLAAGTAAVVLATAGAAAPLTSEGLLAAGADGLGTLAASETILGGTAAAGGVGATTSLIGRIGTYAELTAASKGSGLRVHHIIEQRFSRTLGLNAGHMMSVVLDTNTHQVFTNAWRNAIGYTSSGRLLNTNTATPAQIFNAARNIYQNHPELLKAIGIE